MNEKLTKTDIAIMIPSFLIMVYYRDEIMYGLFLFVLLWIPLSFAWTLIRWYLNLGK